MIPAELILAKERIERQLLALPGVTGVDIGYKVVGGQKTRQLAIRVLVKKKQQNVPVEQRVPAQIEGFPTDVIEREFKLVVDRTQYDPLFGGGSIGPCRLSIAGTLGCLVVDNATGAPMVLSNFHVLCGDASSSPGDTITQPAIGDGGYCPTTVIGVLARHSLGGTVDCAVATIDSSREARPHIVNIGTIRGQGIATLDMPVQKRGRTTGLTHGTVDSVELSVTTDYGPGIGNVILFHQIGIEPNGATFLDHGDSGSALVDLNRNVVGLCYAGTTDGHGVANPIADVLAALDVHLYTNANESIIESGESGAPGESSDIEDFVSWPDDLPTPLPERTHSLNPRTWNTVMESGRVRVRRSLEAVEMMEVTWEFTLDQYDAFEKFFISELGRGVERFVMHTLEPSPTEGEIYEVTRLLCFSSGNYSFSTSDNNVTVSAVLEIDQTQRVSISDPDTHEQPMPPIEVTYPPSDPNDPDSPVCYDEISIVLPTITGLENVVIQFGPSGDGPWFFWGETRQAVSSFTLSNYFADWWVRIVAQTSSGSFVSTFKPLAPLVLPPTFIAQAHHFETADYTDAVLSSRALIYEATSAMDVTRLSAGVYPGNLVDPTSGSIAYVVPLFSDAFVEVGPRYYLEIKPAGSDNNMGIKVTCASEQVGVELRITTDGTNPTLTNGFHTLVDVQPFQDTPKPRSVVIARAFKDGCKSPPVYILLDWGREATAQISAFLHEGAYTATMWCGRFIHQLVSPGVCVIAETGSQPGASSEQASPCSPPSNPTLLDSAIANSCGSSTVNEETFSGGSLLLQEITQTEVMHFETSSHYDGPDPHTCPSGPWGGGQWRCGVSTAYLDHFAYNWQTDYHFLPDGDLYLIEASVSLNGAPQITVPDISSPRPMIEMLTGASGASTNDLPDALQAAVPESVSLCPGDGASARLYSVNVTQTCCNN